MRLTGALWALLKGLAFILKAMRSFKQGGHGIRVTLENDCGHSVDNVLKVEYGAWK